MQVPHYKQVPELLRKIYVWEELIKVHELGIEWVYTRLASSSDHNGI